MGEKNQRFLDLLTEYGKINRDNTTLNAPSPLYEFFIQKDVKLLRGIYQEIIEANRKGKISLYFMEWSKTQIEYLGPEWEDRITETRIKIIKSVNKKARDKKELNEDDFNEFFYLVLETVRAITRKQSH